MKATLTSLGPSALHKVTFLNKLLHRKKNSARKPVGARAFYRLIRVDPNEEEEVVSMVQESKTKDDYIEYKVSAVGDLQKDLQEYQ